MSNVPFLFINLIAMCGYAIIFISFIAAKKTREIKAFIALMTSFMLWTGGSILMRLQVAPGLEFWYYVSILALFCIAVLTYIFVCSFIKNEGTFLKTVWLVGTFIILILTAKGVFLKPPEPMQTSMGTVFVYHMGWQIAIPYAFFACIIVSIIKVIRKAVRRTGYRAPGLNAMILGCIIIAAGNLLQIIPGNAFPWDTLSGIISAGFLVWALYKKRMFRLTLLVSKGIIVFASVFICLLIAVEYAGSFNRLIVNYMHISDDIAASFVIVAAIGFTALCRTLLQKLMDAMFTREEQQGKLIKAFSQKISQTLESESVMEIISQTIRQEIPVENVYICLNENGEYKFRYVSSPLATSDFSLTMDTPCAEYALNNERCFTVKDFESSPLYLSMWDNEKLLLKQLDIECILALVDDNSVVGLVFLSKKERGNAYTVGEIDFLSTLGSISAIAMRNAGLYEQVAREARTDPMTGVYNYRYFNELGIQEFNRPQRDCLALLFVDLDDFKLYNQLYGANEGDNILKEVAQILLSDAGDNGEVFRYSGKVFAVLLREYDFRMAKEYAESVQKQIGEINGKDARATYKKLTSSCGICVAPHGASTWNELVDNTDLATFKAKKRGKNNIVTFKSNDTDTRGLSKRVEQLVDNNRNTILGDSAQTIYALTAAIDAKDHYTAQHSNNVARYSAILGAACGMSNDQIRMVYAAGLLHDIGKISVPESILGKNDKLSNDEYISIQNHVNGSIEMIKHLPSMEYLIPAILGHHERWDGKGYPRGIAGTEIPLAARCIAVGDAFDAMTTDRPYRKAMSIEFAGEEIMNGAGTQFDPELAQLFNKLIDEREIEALRIND